MPQRCRRAEPGRCRNVFECGRWLRFEEKRSELERLNSYVGTTSFAGMRINQWLKRPENVFTALPESIRATFSDELWESTEIDLKYAGYISRQEIDIEKLRLREDERIPLGLDYSSVPSLRHESRQKLNKIHPETLGQAARISGVTPADIAILSIFLQTRSC